VVFVIGLGAALFLGIGWVVQQRVATESDSNALLSWSVLIGLISSWLWWLGIAAMTVGQSLSAWALQLGAVSTVEPVLVVSLLVAFIISGVLAHERPRWQELAGPVILCIALAVFLAVGDPHPNRHSDPASRAITIATAAAAFITLVVALAGKLVGRRAPAVVESVLLASAAGIMYGLQDVATRGATVASHHHSLPGLLTTLWPWVVLGSATAGVLLSQAAFRAERLDFALPPTAAAQPIAGIVLGVSLLGDHLSASGTALVFEALCLVGMLAGIILIGRSPSFQ
jgi:drug/metabolite transporter (DMT)-like permease